MERAHRILVRPSDQMFLRLMGKERSRDNYGQILTFMFQRSMQRCFGSVSGFCLDVNVAGVTKLTSYRMTGKDVIVVSEVQILKRLGFNMQVGPTLRG